MQENTGRAARRAAIRQLIDSWQVVPAFLSDRHLTVVASNDAARAVSPSFVEGVNLVRFTFLEPQVRHGDPEWAPVADQVTAMLRDSLDQHEEDASFRDIVGELSARSREFAEAWADETRPEASARVRFTGTVVGSFDLTYQRLRVPDEYDDVLFVFRASDPASHLALAQLIEIASGPTEA
ncbi:hypothetical protein C5B96_15325 [Subtercola sp. Z020]|uniref:MmyB family transcriptional regulator n=1 Tax=Subtercola sp. Z020 TaxID=2080582 RepID=UPI000CE8CBA0|nr:hypothetical protein [Subtercola sp. Z020]PPF77637.1 hypothetical protein C5B96_15325 [Subtercola sp. Z020]